MISFQEKTVEEHQHMVQKILSREKSCRKRVAAAGIDYEFPDFVSTVMVVKFLNCSLGKLK